MPAVPPSVFDVTEMSDDLSRHLALCSDDFLQTNDLVDQHFVGLRKLKILLL